MSQIGTGLITKSAPKFSDYVVVAGTWSEKDNTQIQRTDDGDSAIFNYTTRNPGVDCSCDLVIKVGEVPCKVGDILAEVTPGTRSFVVLAASASDFGGMPLKQKVELAYHTGFTPTVVT